MAKLLLDRGADIEAEDNKVRWLPMYLCVCMFVCVPLCVCMSVCVCVFVCACLCRSVCVCVSLSICLCVHLVNLNCRLCVQRWTLL